MKTDGAFLADRPTYAVSLAGWSRKLNVLEGYFVGRRRSTTLFHKWLPDIRSNGLGIYIYCGGNYALDT